ncbi:MAG: NFACT family protein, partial [Suilimivivens sp.]
MAFDGITVAAVVKELKENLSGGRIYKIAQPESDELLLTIKTTDGGQKRLFLSAEASLPLIYLTETNKPSPITAPGFCMLLRKHLQNGRITDITQPGLERIIQIHIEHLNEMGDLCKKRLVIEIMGKHSNIIFINEDNMIIDSIKHISGMVSSVREVLPGRNYFIPLTQDKGDPLTASFDSFKNLLTGKAMPVFKALYSSYTGLSPVAAHEICAQADIDGDSSTAVFTEAPEGEAQFARLYQVFDAVMNRVKTGDFSPTIVYENGAPIEFAALPLLSYSGKETEEFASISVLLEQYYARKNQLSRIRQKSADLRKIVQTALERNVKKYDLQIKQMQDTEKKDKYKVYGELLNTYGYDVAPGAKSMEALNYYTNEMITVP